VEYCSRLQSSLLSTRVEIIVKMHVYSDKFPILTRWLPHRTHLATASASCQRPQSVQIGEEVQVDESPLWVSVV
jgi:hypothetical protein